MNQEKERIVTCEKCGKKLRIPEQENCAKIRCGNPECRFVFNLYLEKNKTRSINISKPFKKIGIYIFGILILVALVYFRTDKIVFPPDNTIVFVDSDSKTYFAPPLLTEDKREFLVATKYSYAAEFETMPASKEVALDIDVIMENKTIYVDLKKNIYFVSPQDNYVELFPDILGAVKERGFSPDETHRDLEAFIDVKKFYDKILSLRGKRKSRWTDSGSWNW